MKKLSGILSGIFLLTIFGCNAPETSKFGVVDVAKVVSTSKTSQKANADIEALIKSKQLDLNKKLEALKNLEKSIKEPGSKVKPEEYNKAAAEYQKLAGAADTEVKNKAAELRKSVLDQIKKIIDGIGNEEKLTMIFIAETVPYHRGVTDITDKVVKKLDEAAGGNGPTAPPATKPAPPANK